MPQQKTTSTSRRTGTKAAPSAARPKVATKAKAEKVDKRDSDEKIDRTEKAPAKADARDRDKGKAEKLSAEKTDKGEKADRGDKSEGREDAPFPLRIPRRYGMGLGGQIYRPEDDEVTTYDFGRSEEDDRKVPERGSLLGDEGDEDDEDDDDLDAEASTTAGRESDRATGAGAVAVDSGRTPSSAEEPPKPAADTPSEPRPAPPEPPAAPPDAPSDADEPGPALPTEREPEGAGGMVGGPGEQTGVVPEPKG